MTMVTEINQISSLYEQDFCLWIETTVKLLKERNLKQLDYDNLIEEIESMGRSERRELENRLIVLIIHLLKCKYQTNKLSKSLILTIKEQRRQVKKILKNSPSLRSYLDNIISECYHSARFEASEETRLNLVTFPEINPFSLAEILNDEFFST
jgi:formyltetrahydrofolate synthetase